MADLTILLLVDVLFLGVRSSPQLETVIKCRVPRNTQKLDRLGRRISPQSSVSSAWWRGERGYGYADGV